MDYPFFDMTDSPEWDESWATTTSRAKDQLSEGPQALGPLRPVIKESWLRSLQRVDPGRATPTTILSRSDLLDYRNSHALAPLVPIVHKLLLRYTLDQGLIVALGDEAGRLLWVDGDDQAMRRAESMAFIEGADWSEESMGTSAPGTAIATAQGVQVHAIEHFSHIVEPWSCSAIPIREPQSKRVLGVLDITGGDDAVAPATIPLLQATAAAMESQLALQQHTSKELTGTKSASTTFSTPGVLRVLGRDLAVIESPHHPALSLGKKHSEILTLLAVHRQGLSAESLSEMIYGPDRPSTTIRAEVSRLKSVLDKAGTGISIESRPYRLVGALDSDIQRVKGFLTKGAHRVALAKYSGPVLPTSGAPGIEQLRADVHVLLREVLMQDASVDVLLDYASLDESAMDIELWRACLQLLPARSPRRAEVVLRIEALEAECNDVQPLTP